LVCEQNEITIHIKKIDTVFEAVGIRVEAEIKALSEYKTSLISAVVTGKIKAG
jgi:hypothetical protein